jgi:tetratricopeptide (TPR) repeat protein
MYNPVMFDKKRRKHYLLSTIMTAYLSVGIALAAGEITYKGGLQAYNKKDFRSAAEKFQASIAQGNKTPIVFLYLGHAYFGSGEVARALTAYCNLADKFPATSEALLAIQQIQRLDPNMARKYAALYTSLSAATAPGAATKQELISKLVVIEPKFGHPKVSQHSIEIVKSAIRRLDPRISKIFVDSGTSITIAPNTLDRWPEGGGDTVNIPGEDQLLAEAGGQTYHRDNMGPDINIFERQIVRGTKRLKEPGPDDSLFRTSLHEMGHAVDDLQKLSKDSTFLAAHAQDVKELSSDDRTQYHYFTTPMEACAEITGGLIGHNEADSETSNVIRCFPRSAKWLKQRLYF